jgi:hypothetical protein
MDCAPYDALRKRLAHNNFVEVAGGQDGPSSAFVVLVDPKDNFVEFSINTNGMACLSRAGTGFFSILNPLKGEQS